jgi:hypothetical protein
MVEIVLRNPPAGSETSGLWRLHLVGTDAAMNLFVYALLIAVGQRQFADLNRARLTIESAWTTRTGHGAAVAVREISLHNTGKGIATILKVSFAIGSPAAERPTVVTLERLTEILDSGGLRDGLDYEITNFTPGATIASHGAQIFVSCSETAVAKLEAWSFVVRYETAGDIYEKYGSLLPYAGAADPAP